MSRSSASVRPEFKIFDAFSRFDVLAVDWFGVIRAVKWNEVSANPISYFMILVGSSKDVISLLPLSSLFCTVRYIASAI